MLCCNTDISWASVPVTALVGHALHHILSLATGSTPHPPPKKQKSARGFDFSRFGTRHIAIQFSYEGGPYNGLTSNGPNEEESVEAQLLMACIKTKLIPDRASACVSRCGRTDRGVNALRQVVGLRVRSILSTPSTSPWPPACASSSSPCASPDQHAPRVIPDANGDADSYNEHAETTVTGGFFKEEAEDPALDPAALAAGGNIWSASYDTRTEGELDYTTLLNRVLPLDIRVLGWAPVPDGFSARFCCSYRTYRYFFDGDGYDLGRMSAAAGRLVGEHDFRNFCKMDVTTVQSFVRVVREATVLTAGEWGWALDSRGPMPGPSSTPARRVCCLQIQGQAFLWHMVRCIMAVLFAVGRGQEEVGVVDDLLDVSRYPGKPLYALASEHALVLHDCHFERLRFHHQPSALFRLWTELRLAWGQTAVRLARLQDQMGYVGELAVRKAALDGWVDAELGMGRFQGSRFQKQEKKKKGKRREAGGGEGAGTAGGGGGEGGSKTCEAMNNESGSVHGVSDRGGEAEDEKSVGKKEDTVLMTWRDALAYLSAQGIVPDLEVSKKKKGIWTPYVPLKDRPLGKTYEEAVLGMGTKKRELYEQAQRKRKAAETKGGMEAFFHNMRGTSPGPSLSSSGRKSPHDKNVINDDVSAAKRKPHRTSDSELNRLNHLAASSSHDGANINSQARSENDLLSHKGLGHGGKSAVQHATAWPN